MARLQILNPAAQNAFDSPPPFDHRERQSAFDFSNVLVELARTLRQPSYQVLFLVSCGYFKASKRFFSPTSYHLRDLDYVARKLSLEGLANWDYPDRARQRHQRMILDFYGFRPFGANVVKAVEVEIATMAQQYLKPRLIFERCADLLVQQKYQVPKAGTLVELIRVGLQARKAELVGVMGTQLSDEARALLDGLFTTADESNRYRLTLLKRTSQSSKPTQIKESVADFETVSELFEQLAPTVSSPIRNHCQRHQGKRCTPNIRRQTPEPVSIHTYGFARMVGLFWRRLRMRMARKPVVASSLSGTMCR